MLQKLTIKNFLRNKKLSIIFGKHITTIVGKSAAGKSSAVRALRYAMQNIPAGCRFINWDADEAKVILKADDHKIVRRRSVKINTYKLDKRVMKSFKHNVPDDIKNLMNVSDINFQRQDAKHFWFSLSPPEVGRQLNQIVNLENIDTALSKISSKIRTTKTKEKIHAVNVSSLRQIISESSYIIDLNSQLTSIENHQETINTRTRQMTILNDLISDGTSSRDLEFDASGRARAAVVTLLRFDRLRNMEFESNTLKKTLKTAKKAAIMTRTPVPDIGTLSSCFDWFEQTTKQKRELKILIGEAKTWRSKKRKENTRKKHGENSLAKILKNACPICGTPIKY